MTDTFNRDEFVSGYLAEAEEHLQIAGQNLLRIEQEMDSGEPQPRLVRELFRSLHTLKGLSAMVGIEPIVAIAHEMETILRVTDKAATPLSPSALEVLLSGLTAIEQRVRSFSRREPIQTAPEALIGALQVHASRGAKAIAPVGTLDVPPQLLAKLTSSELEQLTLGIRRGQRALRVEFVPSAERARAGISITSVRERLGALGEIVKVVPGSVPKTADSPGGLIFTLFLLSQSTNTQVADAASASEADVVAINYDAPAPRAELPEEDPQDTGEGFASGTIRVQVTRLDDALEKLSALVVSRFRLTRAVAKLREQGVDVRELSALLGEHTREMRQMRSAITRARMISVSQLLERMPLLVRGMSKSAGKQVKLQVDAGRTELDKGVAERMFPALLHLVRNAVDHAIEPPEERTRRGKPAHGTVTIRAFERDGNQLEISVSDDGRGIDRERVAQKAGKPVPKDDAALLALITRPGLSTQDVATERSGRGMGMDIVRRVTTDTLGGELSVRTEPNVGTSFTVRVPLSISLLDAISFLCGEQTFVAPLGTVDEIVELALARVTQGPAPKRAGAPVSMLRQRDDDIPLFDLKALFGMPHQTPGQSAVIVRRGEKRFAFAVDKMLTQQELVIRPIEDPLVKVRGVSGTTDLGDGRPTLVLDLPALSAVAGERVQAASR